MGRPRLYASAAEKQKAFRERYVVRDIRIKTETDATISRLCESMDLPRSEVVNQLLQFALTNRAWHILGTFTKLLPRKTNPDEE